MESPTGPESTHPNRFPTPADAERSEAMNDTFTKFYLPDGRVLHRFTAANDVDFHDHPFPFVTTIGPAETDGYHEEILAQKAGQWVIERHERLPGATHRVEASTIHRLTGLRGSECWTVITPGEKEREPGFYRLVDHGSKVQHRFWHESDWHPWPRDAATNL